MEFSMFDDCGGVQPKSFFRWVGGKARLIDPIRFYFPKSFNSYWEPFLGGGAVFFNLAPEKAHLNDVNPVLINCYRWLKEDLDLVWHCLESFSLTPDTKEGYNENRDLFNSLKKREDFGPEFAALFIWLMSNGFNGLYRENSNGEFNVPKGSRNQCPTLEELKACSELLKSNCESLEYEDFEEFLKPVQPGDFVYLDPPYIPYSSSRNFTNYVSGGFSEEDHVRVADLCKQLHLKHVKFMVSNSDSPMAHELYSGFNFRKLNISHCIQTSSVESLHTSECLITNY